MEYHQQMIHELRARKAVVDAEAEAASNAITELDKQTNFICYNAFYFNCVIALYHAANNPDIDFAFDNHVRIQNTQFGNDFFDRQMERAKLSELYRVLWFESQELATRIRQHEDRIA